MTVLAAFGRPAVRVAAALHVALAIALCFVPLFDNLGFERAFATGLLTALTAPAVAASVLAGARARGGADPLRVAAVALWVSLTLLAPTAIAGWSVEALRAPCDRSAGLVFLILVAGGNAAFGVALGVLAGTVDGVRGLRVGLVAVVLVGFFAAALWRLYAHPQIFAYSVPWGFWPGSLYDEELEVSASLWAFRGYTVLYALTVLLLVRALTAPGALRLGTRVAPLGLLAAALAGLATYGAHQAGGDLGYDLDTGSVKDALSRHIQTEHFDIYADPSLGRAQAQRLVEDHELRYAQLADFFGVEPERRITSFVYRDVAQKARLMGAGRTMIARPWAHQIHIHGFDVPHRVLNHELAHVFAAELASPPFYVPAELGIFVNIGVVEGVAVAADWPVRELTVHGWAKAMKALGLLPDMRRSLGPTGFWAVSSSRAYTAAGSFLRYLVDTYGMDRLAVLYGGNDFEAAYDRPLDALVAEWEAFLDARDLPEDALAMAEHRFTRPSIFQKVCAHRAANLERRGRQRLSAGDLEGGIADLEQLLAYRDNDPGPRIRIAEALAKDGRLDAAEARLEAALAMEDITEAARARAKEALAGVAWRREDLARAEALYREILRIPLSTAFERMQRARLAALDRPPAVQDVLRPYLLGELAYSLALVRLGELSARRPGDALVRYLYARLLERAEAYPEGVDTLRAMDAGALPGEALPTEAELTLGRLLLWSGSATTAAARFEALERSHPRPAIRAEAADWRARARFSWEIGVDDGELDR